MQLLIIDDHPLTCHGLSALLMGSYAHAVIRTAHTALDARVALQQAPKPDWLFLDLNLQDDPDHQLFHQLCDSPFIVNTILVSAEPRYDLIHAALVCGARGFIPKVASSELVLSGFAAILRGEFYVPLGVAAQLKLHIDGNTTAVCLSPRLLQVQDQLFLGASNKQIAKNLNLSPHTVKEYVSSVLAFNDVHSRLELVLKRGKK